MDYRRPGARRVDEGHTSRVLDGGDPRTPIAWQHRYHYYLRYYLDFCKGTEFLPQIQIFFSLYLGNLRYFKLIILLDKIS